MDYKKIVNELSENKVKIEFRNVNSNHNVQVTFRFRDSIDIMNNSQGSIIGILSCPLDGSWQSWSIYNSNELSNKVYPLILEFMLDKDKNKIDKLHSCLN